MKQKNHQPPIPGFLNRIRLILGMSLLFGGLLLAGEVPYHPTPDWISAASGYYATGLGIADINGDGWDDIIVANGNDMARQPLTVYYNNGDGTFPMYPAYISGDADYHGHLAVGDINGDGWPDVAVSVFLGPGRFFEPGWVKVYFNQGGGLESLPSYRTADSLFTFSCALGDADGDGDLDLAVAGGQPYAMGLGPYQTSGRIYFNHGGTLDSLPGWLSSVPMSALDVDFADMDHNGFLDVIFACHLTPNYIFLADSTGQIASQPSWRSADPSYYANSLAIGRIDGDPFPDLAISDNNQLGGSGKFKAYLFHAPPTGTGSPAWYSAQGGYGSAVALEDLDGDGLTDLLAGRWWGRVELFRGNGNGFGTAPDWWSATSSVVEAFALRDVNRDGYRPRRDTLAVVRDSVHLVSLNAPTAEKITSVFLNGQPLVPGTDYATLPGKTWISFARALKVGDVIVADYFGSQNRDLVVTNWDQNTGNYLFYNQRTPTGLRAPAVTAVELAARVFPNPVNQRCRIQVLLPVSGSVEIRIYDALGRTVRILAGRRLTAGRHDFFWDGERSNGQPLPSGVYFYRVQLAGRGSIRGKLILIR